MLGQINLGSTAGNFIYNTCLQKENKIIVEIGTWNGMGSTNCIMQALFDKEYHEEDCLLSLESNKKMFDEAKESWKRKLVNYNSIYSDKLKLIHGRIIEKEDLISLEEIKTYNDFIIDWENWYQEDIKSIESCKNIFDNMPNKIDVLVLDGGEFSTLSEFNKLKDRSKIIICDDTKTVKCRKIRKILLEDNNYEVLIDLQHERNGFSAFRRKT